MCQTCQTCPMALRHTHSLGGCAHRWQGTRGPRPTAGSLLSGGAAVNSYRLGSSPCAVRGSGAGVLEGLQAKPVTSTAVRRDPISGATAHTLNGAAAARRAALAAEEQRHSLCYMVNVAVFSPSAPSAAGRGAQTAVVE